jgi:hypothetical protein
MSSSKCVGFTKQGAECKRNAREGFQTCYQHKDNEPDEQKEEPENEETEEPENEEEEAQSEENDEEDKELENELGSGKADKTVNLLQMFSSGNFTISTK